MPIYFKPRSDPEKVGPPPAPEAIEKFQEFYDAPTIQEAQAAFSRLLEILELEPNQFQIFFPKFKYALKHHLPFKYKEIWKLLENKSKQKPYGGGVADKQTVW